MKYKTRKKEFEAAYVKELFEQPHEFIRDLIKLSGMPILSFYRLLERTNTKLPTYGSPERPMYIPGTKRT